ncbi:TPA: hypothetical protein DEG21_05270 [Patescibacteria group bacterium]|nr:hypothetical protein [Candidatus Gracilibacteria bacterium]HBY75239.1 hypothetical protein [Candidatus Gracilibacteria bacterium]
MILKAAKIPAIYYPDYTFSDIKSTDWWAGAVSTAKKLDYANKNNKNYNPLRSISRAEALQIIMKIK